METGTLNKPNAEKLGTNDFAHLNNAISELFQAG